MKKLKFLFAALAIVAGGSTAGAQTDVTAQYLTNANFSEGTPVDNNVCTYGKDMQGNGTTYYGAQPIEGWTNESVGETDEKGYENSKLAGALFSYGSTPWLAGSGTTAPATDPDGNAGNAAGLCAVWGASVQYTQAVTLPAGSYTIRFKTYNATTDNGSGKFITTNLFGFVADGGTTYYAPSKTFAIGQWSTIAVTFNLTEETVGKISMGYVGPLGNAGMPHLFVDNVKILKNTYYEDVTNKVGVKAAKNESNPDWINSTDGLQGSVTTDDGRNTGMAARYGTSAAGTVIYQTVTGLKKGTYEAVLFAYSQNEWNNNGASLTHDAGDVGFVMADGKYTVKEWINARRGPGYPADGPGIYSLTGIEVDDNGELTLGYAIDKANQTEWHAVQIKSLIYTKNLDLSGFVAAYNVALTAAKEVDQTKKMAASIKTALNNAIDTYNEGKVDLEDADALEAAADALNTATANANASIADYAALLTAITNANNYSIYKPVFSGSSTTYSTAVSNAQAVYDAGEVEDCSVAITALTNGIHSAYENDYSVFANDYVYDYSTLLDQDMTKWTTTDYVTMTANEHWNGLTSQRYYEQSGAEWSSNAWSHAASETTVLPVGKYVMSITARASSGVTSTMSVKVGDSEALTVALPNKGASGRGITTSGVGSYADDGIYANTNGRGWEYRFIAFEVTEETPVTISFSSSTNEIYNWVSLAAPLLKGNVHPNQIKLNQVKSLAETLAEYKNQISEETYATFAEHITAANEATVESTNLDDIITNLQADIETAKAEVKDIAAARAAFQTLKGYADALVAVANDNSAANTALATAISEQTTATEVNNVETINEATSTLKTAMVTYVGTANPTEGNQFDCTFMLTNPDVTPFWDGTWRITPEGWYNEQSGGNFQVMANENLGPGGEVFMEYWSATPAQSGFVLCQKVTLPEGTYKMAGRVAANFDGQGGTVQNVFFAANDAIGTQITSETLIDADCEFVQGNAEPVEVKIGMIATEGNEARWMAINKIQLFKVPAKAFELDENTAWDNTKSGAGNVNLTRTIKQGYNTLTLPFSMTQAEVEEMFGEGSKVYALKAYDADKQLISFTTREGIAPNVPCLLKAAEAGTSYTIEGRTIVAGTPEAIGTDVSMIGTYAASMTVPTGSYVISNGKIYLVDNAVTLKNTRAYIKLKPENPGDEFEEVRIIDMSFDDGETTAIATMENGQLNIETGDIYDLSGRKVKNPAKGIYLMNGKKVIK